MIPLYPPNPAPPVPADLTTLPWWEVAKEAEQRLHKWLGCEPGLDVMLVDRATHGLELCFRLLRERCGLNEIRIPNRTYRAAKDAAQSAGFTEIQPVPDHTVRTAPHYLSVPTTLGGLALSAVHSWGYNPCVIDAAHTAVPGMFRDYGLGPLTLAVLSFYPTKPLGAYGGGCIVGAQSAIAQLRHHSEPGLGHCRFYYPQTVQSYGVLARLDTWEPHVWARRRMNWEAAVRLVGERFGLRPAWGRETPQSPHLLPVVGPEEGMNRLRALCCSAQIETGAHYPPINRRGRPHISVPFWSEEFLSILSGIST